MVSNRPIDLYTVVLEDASTNGLKYERVIARNTSTELTAEARFSTVQTRKLIEFAYGGEQRIVDNLIEQAEAGNAIELLANSKDFCVFTAEELARLGFDPDELLAAQRIKG
ncbi:MAG: hypothetical protein ABSD61_00725 [Terracidiphilus sp.]|jgi:hypothetical protein